MVMSAFVGLPGKATMRRLRNVVHAASWLHSMVLHGRVCCCLTEDGIAALNTALKIVVDGLNDDDDLLWYTVYSEDAPETLSMDAVEGFSKVNEVDVQSTKPLSALLSRSIMLLTVKSGQCILFHDKI